MDFYNNLKSESFRLSSKISVIEKELSRLPEGALRFWKNGNSYKHYLEKNGFRKYIPLSQIDLIAMLAKKDILKKMLQDTRREKEAIDAYLRKHREEDSVAARLVAHPHLEELVHPMFQVRDDRLRIWAEADYPSTAGHPEDLIHEGPRGQMFRSKSESHIAIRLFANRIPYRYEWDRTINGIVYHIDFTIRHPKTGEIFYWEHFGRIDDEKYNRKNARKLADYESVGIFPNKNLILTYESKRFPLNFSTIDAVIEKWFLN